MPNYLRLIGRQKHTRMIGDTLEPLYVVCYLNEDPALPYDWTSKTPSFVLEEEDGTDITEAGTISAHPTQTFTVSATTDLLTAVGHGVRQDDQVIVSTTTTLPAGLSASTRYHAVEVTPNSFGVATQPGGAKVDITDTGTGTHSFYVVGSVQLDFGAGDVDEAGFFRLWVKSTSATEVQTFPASAYGVSVEITALGN